MTQPYDPNIQNIENPEEVRIRRMLAYKSLIISILQRSFIFLLLVAIVVASVVLLFLHRKGQKNFYRWRTSVNLIYKPSKVKNHDQPPLTIMNVFQIISTGEVKKNAGTIGNITPWKQPFLGNGLEVSQDKKVNNTLTLSVKWDNSQEARALAENYAEAAKLEYASHRGDDLREQLKTLNKQKTPLVNDIDAINEKINKLSSSYTSSLDQELDKLQNRAFRMEEEIAGYIQQKTRLDKKLNDINNAQNQDNDKNAQNQDNDKREDVNEQNKLRQKQAIIKANYKYFLELIRERDEARIQRNKQLEKFKPEHPNAVIAEKELFERQSLLEKVLKNYNLAEEEIMNMDSNTIDIQTQLDTLEQLISTAQNELNKLQKRILEVRDLNQQTEKLKEDRLDKSNQIAELDKKENDIYFLIEQSINELHVLTVPYAPYAINGLGPKQYIVALFAGGVFAGFIAVIIILLAAQFGCISTATELHDLAEIEVFSLSESELKKLEPAELTVAAHNVFYVLNQIIEDRQYLFYGALQGSYSTALLFEQLLLQFAMNGTRIFILNLEPYDNTSEGEEEEENNDEEAPEDLIANDLLGVEKNGDSGIFKLGNASFISPNEQDILKMDVETLLKHYDKIVFRRKTPFTGKELMFKQIIALTQCCIFSVGKKRSPRSFLKLLRDNKGTEENIIAGIFTEP